MSNDHATEVWRDVIGYEGHYQVSSHGRIKSLARYMRPARPVWIQERIVSIHEFGRGYMYVVLCKNNKKTNFCVHRLVAMAFIPNPEGKREVNHKDMNKKNNRVDNLEWVTSAENKKHAADHGISNRGERAGQAKLTTVDVLAIRAMAGKMSSTKIAAMFAVGPTQVLRIINRKRWYHLPEETNGKPSTGIAGEKDIVDP